MMTKDVILTLSTAAHGKPSDVKGRVESTQVHGDTTIFDGVHCREYDNGETVQCRNCLYCGIGQGLSNIINYTTSVQARK